MVSKSALRVELHGWHFATMEQVGSVVLVQMDDRPAPPAQVRDHLMQVRELAQSFRLAQAVIVAQVAQLEALLTLPALTLASLAWMVER